MDKRIFIVIGPIVLISAGLLVVWGVQGKSMEGDFREALRAGTIDGVHRDLVGKQWSPEELATIEVIKIAAGAGKERALERAVHARGRIVIASGMYEFQGTIRDNATNIVHLFGYRRSDPRKWCWEGIHPESMPQHLQRRMQQLEEMKNRARQQ